MASFSIGKVMRAQLIRIFLFLVDSIIAAILSSISTVKSLSIMARVSPEEILNPSTTAFFLPLEVCFKRDILKKFEKFSFSSFKMSYVLSLLLPSTNIISNLLGIFLNLFKALINSSLLPASFLAGITIDIKSSEIFSLNL